MYHMLLKFLMMVCLTWSVNFDQILFVLYVFQKTSFLRLLCHNCWTINHAKFVFLSYDFANLILTSKTIAFQISMRKNISEILTACLFEIWKKKTAQNFYIITISIYY